MKLKSGLGWIRVEVGMWVAVGLGREDNLIGRKCVTSDINLIPIYGLLRTRGWLNSRAFMLVSVLSKHFSDQRSFGFLALDFYNGLILLETDSIFTLKEGGTA